MINKAILIGNLGNDPEIRYTQAGTAVASFTMATAEKWKDQNGEWQERTEWHRIVCWGKLADTCGEHLQKGSKIYLEGKIQTRKWQDQNGNDRYTTEIVGREIKFLSPRSESQQSSGGYQDPPYPSGGMGEDVPF